MTDRYDDDDRPGDDRLDEFLCEYVDGTMDESVKSAFEEYLAVNPDLAEHARRLMLTRSLLCSRQQCAHAPRDLQHRLQVEIARDLMGAAPREGVVCELGRFATLTSAIGMAVLLGALVGTSFVQRRAPLTGGGMAERWSDHPAAPSDAHGYPGHVGRAALRAAGFGVMGPSSAMPVVAWSEEMTPISGTDSLSASALRRTHAVP